MVALGALYRDGGDGMAQDHVKARDWYEKAAAADPELCGDRVEKALKTLPIR